MANLTVYKSSAGSGKTFTLVLNYLKLLLKTPYQFRHILAVTFTNKATREMKERIIEQLSKMAAGEHTKMAMIIEKDEQLNKNEKLDWQKQASITLSLILHDYSRFQVTTIDSFFHQVIRSFAKELNLPLNFEVELDQTSVLNAISDEVMLDIGRDQSLTRWLRDFAFSKMEEDKGWDIQRDIRELGRELFNEQFQKIQYKIFKGQQDLRTDFENLLKALNQIVHQYEQTANRYAQKVMDLVESFGLEPRNFKGGVKSGLIGDFRKLIDNRDPGKLENFYIKFQKLEGPEELSSKNSEFKEKILQCAENGLWERLIEVADFYEKQKHPYQTALAIKSNFYSFGILSDLSNKLKAYRQAHELLMISDMNNLLRQITTQTDVPFLYEKVGQHYQHFLIDEFQDTSDFQWDNFKPLLLNALAGRQFSMLVGDVKQSIYRWRGGNPRLLMDQIFKDFSQFESSLQEETLSVNYRSRGLIVRFNNAFFGLAPSLIAKNTQIPNGEILTQAYEDVVQQPADPYDEEGYVEIQFLKEEKSLPFQEQARNELLEKLGEIFNEGYQYRDVAILVRTNLEAKRTANFLNIEASSYPVISTDSLVLGYSTKVKFLVNLLGYLHDPSNAMVKTRLLNDYLRYLKGDDQDGLHSLFSDVKDGQDALFRSKMPKAFFEKFPAISRLPLYEMVEELIDLFDLNIEGDAYIQRFLDQVLDYGQQYRVDIPGFIEWWWDKGRQEAVQVPEAANAIRIETVHRAKGLEYPVVMVPYAKWEMGHKGGAQQQFLWVSPDKAPFDQVPYLPVALKQSLADTYFAEPYYEDLLFSYLDNLNLLYVTLTRAIDQLYIWAPDPHNAKGELNSKNVNGLLYQVIKEGGYQSEKDLRSHWNEEESCLTLGSKPRLQPSANPEKGVHQLPGLPTNPWRDKLTIRPRANQMVNEERDNPSAVDHGLIVHGILEQMTTKEDLDRILNKFYSEGLFTKAEQERLKKNLKTVLELPEVENWFTANWQIMNEREILMPDGIVYRPDRVMTFGSKAKVAEFKTGKPENTHERQVRAYAEALSQLGYEEIKPYLLYIADKEVREVPV